MKKYALIVIFLGFIFFPIFLRAAIPYVFATQTGGNVPASYLDSDFSYVDLKTAGGSITGSLALSKTSGDYSAVTATAGDNSNTYITLTNSTGYLRLLQGDNTSGIITQDDPIIFFPGGVESLIINTNGHIEHVGSAPGVSGCGSGATVAGNDNDFFITVGTSSTATCTATFATAWINAPICIAQNSAAESRLARVSASATGTITITGSASYNSGDKIWVQCAGYR